MRIRDLQPGYLVRMKHHPGYEATFVGLVESHPLYPNLVMVIWHHPADNLISPSREFSFDALSPNMELPADQTVTFDGAINRIQAIIRPGR
jgi:hypothetical protein